MMELLETVFVRNNLVVAFAVVGVTIWLSYLLANKLTAGRIHGSAIAIAVGLLAAWYGGVATGGNRGIADFALLSGIGLMGGGMMRWVRTMMLEVLRQDYIRTAWSKGLVETVVVARHALKNTMIPVVTIMGLQIPILIGGNIIIEQIFNLPGMGFMTITALNTRDYPLVSGIMIVLSFGIVLINVITDIMYGVLDPKVQYD